VQAVGLFGKTQARPLLRPLNCCGAGDRVEVTSGGQTVAVTRVLAPPDSYAPSAAWDRFDRLVAELTAPDDWISVDGWASGSWQPYRAASFCLTLERGQDPSPQPLQASALTWPTGVEPFASFGVPSFEGADSRTGSIPATAAYDLAASLVNAARAAGVPNDGWYVTPLQDGGSLTSPGMAAGGGWTMQILLAPIPPGPLHCPWL
jgi:hypothetical protein